MENASDALKMGAWVLIFVVALSICINAFGQAKECFETILNNADREYLTSYIPPSGNTQRLVGFESIIPSIYREFKENYKVVFPKDYVLYKYEGQSINSIDLTINGYTDDVKEEFLKRILYGIKRFSTQKEKEYTASHFSNIDFDEGGLYEKIQGKMFKESLGVYDPDETEGATSTPEANKKERRVITYEEVEEV